jgi:hypothetical protein
MQVNVLRLSLDQHPTPATKSHESLKSQQNSDHLNLVLHQSIEF